ncbi:MAG: GNAT family N-acetyltransferase [Clostridia bacterium]|nr:GNAT family N-acetyltransferase [Clostridia bacterium]
MIIRFLTQSDVSEHEKVASQAFVFSTDINDPDAVLPCEKVLGAFDDDDKTLFADLEIHEKRCHYDGGFLTCAGVGGVAAKPEHRGRGAVKALFDKIFSENEYDIAILYPFSEAYYRKLGFERVGYALSATVPFAELSEIEKNRDAVLYEGDGTDRLLEIYNRCAEKYNLCFVRDTAEMFPDKPYLSQSYTYIWRNNAFATFSVDRAKSTVFVKEICFDSLESMRGIVGFLRNYESNQKNVCFQNIPENAPLLRCIRDMRSSAVTLRDIGAARILNIEKVLKAHRYPQGSGEFTIRIENEAYHVSYSENGVEIDRNGGRDPDAVMGIGRASELLLCGFADAEYIPDLVIRNPGSDFFRAFPPKTTFFSDDL